MVKSYLIEEVLELQALDNVFPLFLMLFVWRVNYEFSDRISSQLTDNLSQSRRLGHDESRPADYIRVRSRKVLARD